MSKFTRVEPILRFFSQVFYLGMIVIIFQFVLRKHTWNPFDLTMSITLLVNAGLFGLTFYFCTQRVPALVAMFHRILMITMIGCFIVLFIYKLGFMQPEDAIVNHIIEFFFIYLFLTMRYLTVCASMRKSVEGAKDA